MLSDHERVVEHGARPASDLGLTPIRAKTERRVEDTRKHRGSPCTSSSASAPRRRRLSCSSTDWRRTSDSGTEWPSSFTRSATRYSPSTSAVTAWPTRRRRLRPRDGGRRPAGPHRGAGAEAAGARRPVVGRQRRAGARLAPPGRGARHRVRGRRRHRAGRLVPTWEDCLTAMTPPRLDHLTLAQLEARMKRSCRTSASGPSRRTCTASAKPDGTIEPRLQRDRHLAIVRSLWENRPSVRWPTLKTPTLLLLADSGDHKRTEASAAPRPTRSAGGQDPLGVVLARASRSPPGIPRARRRHPDGPSATASSHERARRRGSSRSWARARRRPRW